MDDAWLHSFTSAPATSKEKPSYGRRRSLLEPSVDEKADVAIEPIQEAHNEEDPWRGPPEATLARRAQSYSDFYHVVNSLSKRDETYTSKRRTSFGQSQERSPTIGVDLDFEDQFGFVSDLLLDDSHTRYQTYLEQLQLSQLHLDGLYESTTDTLKLLSTLSDSFEAVQSQTEEFRISCETLITEQRRLAGLADAIDDNVQYFTYLEPITRRLNAPGAANLVKAKDFPEILSNLDSCLTYMEAHPAFKEAPTYRSKYRLLLTRGLTLIRHHFTKSLGEIAADISKRVQGGQLKESTHSALLYAKFRVPAPELKALGLEIHKRAVPTPQDVDAGREPEYLSLLRELYQSYSATRGRLMLPLVAKKMAELASTPQSTDLLAFAKAALTFTRGICLDENELWYEWFETEGALYELLESLIEPMYDYLRPKTIHETKLEKLCDLCAMMQARYMEIDSEEEDDEDEDLDDGAGLAVTNGRSLAKKLDFASLVTPALEDGQTRLVFLAVNALRDGIENYRFKPEDLDCPKRKSATGANGLKKGPVLSGRREPTTPSEAKPPETKDPPADKPVDEDDGVFSNAFAGADTSDSHRQWYPTLRKAIWLLRRIYRLVHSSVFDDLAHRIVHSTIASLLAASRSVTSRKSPQDGHLFLITHLLHLKQQIVAFDIEFVPPEVDFDFSSWTNPFYELRERGSLWNPASWVRLVSGAVGGGGLLPRVVENMLDAKAELDGRLRAVINDFVTAYAGHIAAPLAPAAGAKPGEFDAVKALRTVRGLAEKDVPLLRAKLEEFVDDAKTRETLVAAVRDQVVVTYEDFFDTFTEGKGKRVSRKGKAREDEVWSPDIFVDTMSRVFQVGATLNAADEEDSAGHSGDLSD